MKRSAHAKTSKRASVAPCACRRPDRAPIARASTRSSCAVSLRFRRNVDRLKIPIVLLLRYDVGRASEIARTITNKKRNVLELCMTRPLRAGCRRRRPDAVCGGGGQQRSQGAWGARIGRDGLARGGQSRRPCAPENSARNFVAARRRAERPSSGLEALGSWGVPAPREPIPPDALSGWGTAGHRRSETGASAETITECSARKRGRGPPLLTAPTTLGADHACFDHPRRALDGCYCVTT